MTELKTRFRFAWSRGRRWWYKDRAWLGRLVALNGNRLTLDGCRFNLSHPLVTDAIRARMLRGRYERSERELLAAWLDPGSPVIELGGGLGVVATLINRRLRHPERHVVVEANPSLIPVLVEHRRLNNGQFTIEHAAIDYSGEPSTWLALDTDFISGRVGTIGQVSLTVPTLTVAQLLERYGYDRATLVCDIEGAETQMVEYDGEALVRSIRTMIVEVHPEFRTPAECQAMFDRLERLGWVRLASVRKVHAFRNTHTRGVVAGRLPLLPPVVRAL